MGQNSAARVALKAGGGVSFLQLDAEGRLMVTNEATVASSVAAFSPNEANAIATAQLPAVAGETNYLAGFYIQGTGATAASDVLATVTGLEGGTMEIPIAVPAGVDVQLAPISIQFTQPLPASAADVAIVITLPALGSGSTGAAVGIWGTVG